MPSRPSPRSVLRKEKHQAQSTVEDYHRNTLSTPFLSTFVYLLRTFHTLTIYFYPPTFYTLFTPYLSTSCLPFYLYLPPLPYLSACSPSSPHLFLSVCLPPPSHLLPSYLFLTCNLLLLHLFFFPYTLPAHISSSSSFYLPSPSYINLLSYLLSSFSSHPLISLSMKHKSESNDNIRTQ